MGPRRPLLPQVAFMLLEIHEHGYPAAPVRRAVYGHGDRVPAASPRLLLSQEQELAREAALARTFAKQQAPWLPYGVPPK